MPGDILLVEGNQRISTVIKYLTQSTWSHAAVYIGDAVERTNGDEPCCLIEADLTDGVIAVPLSKYASHNTRICRPVGLSDPDRSKVIEFLVDSIGTAYDLRNVIDLARYLLPTPPVPVRWRRRMLALGSGDPTRGICSTLIAEAFQCCPWCGSQENSFRDLTSAPLVCPSCERGVLAEWKACPWCYEGRFEGNGRPPRHDARAERTCTRAGCEGQLRPFMRYCPLCKQKPRRVWTDAELPNRCPRCRWPTSREFWHFCAWCRRREHGAGHFAGSR